MEVQEAIDKAQYDAKRETIIRRVNEWMARAKDLAIEETAYMVPEDCSVLARKIPTGTVVIKLTLGGIDGDLEVEPVDPDDSNSEFRPI